MHFRRNSGHHVKKSIHGDNAHVADERFSQWIHRFWWTCSGLLTPISSETGLSKAARHMLFVESCFLPFKWPLLFFTNLCL